MVLNEEEAVGVLAMPSTILPAEEHWTLYAIEDSGGSGERAIVLWALLDLSHWSVYEEINTDRNNNLEELLAAKAIVARNDGILLLYASEEAFPGRHSWMFLKDSRKQKEIDWEVKKMGEAFPEYMVVHTRIPEVRISCVGNP